VIANYGEDALERSPCVAWDTTPPGDQNANATALIAIGTALKTLGEALQPYSMQVDAAELCSRFGVPIAGDQDGDGRPDVSVTPIKLAPATAPANATKREAA
jgi:hypothetical protein